MQAGYTVVAKDGNQYGPVDRDTIQRWYYEGRVDRNSRVWESGGHKFRLHEMFDLTVWGNPGLIDEAAAAAAAERDFLPKSDITSIPNERTTGMLAAAVLLLGSGLIELLVIAAFLAQKTYIPQDQMYGLAGAAVVDLVVGAGLFRGNQRFRGFGLGRAVIAGGLLLLRLVVVPPSAPELVMTLFELLMCAGIAALLAGDSPSKLRIGAGVTAVLVAWSGVITTGLIVGFVTGLKQERDLEKYSLPVAGFDDSKLGVNVKLPDGWSMMSADNPIVKLPNATMVALHRRSGCWAALVVEPAIIEIDSLDSYLNLVLQNRRLVADSLIEIGRSDLDFGGNAARRVETSWTTSGLKFHGFTTACRAGWSYYLLTGWCLEGAYSKAFEQYQTLERAFRIKGSASPYDDEQPAVDVRSTQPRPGRHASTSKR